jgi:cytidylate kinase
VRQALVDAQRAFARSGHGAILDGRDIGTIVLPDATVKLFVTASPGVRAGRRYEEIINRGEEADYDTILMDVRRRDERDSGRADSPLRPADDAHLLDTTAMTIDDAYDEAVAIVRTAHQGHP